MLIIDELIINGRKYVYTLKIQINLSNVQILISWQLRVQTIPSLLELDSETSQSGYLFLEISQQ